MNARELRNRIQDLHRLSPKVLDGEVPPEEFWGEIETWFQDAAQAAASLETVLPGDETVPRTLGALHETLRWELQLNRFLLPAIQNREPGETMAHHVVSVFGMMSGDMLDRLFSRLAVFAEVLGLLDGTIEFPEEAYMTYQELWGMAQVTALAADEDLDA
jgi:hypothetical protein